MAIRLIWRYATDNAASAAASRWVYTNSLNGDNRSLERVGADSRLQLQHQSFGITSEAEIGLRYMVEEMHDVTVAATRATPRTGILSRDLRRTDAQGNRATSANTEIMPGAGFTWGHASGLQVFANVYKAFSPALNGDALNGLEDQKLDAERSINVEAGMRGGDGRFSDELTAFRMDFDNQIIPANSNSEFQVTNGGKTLHKGVEAGAGAELGAGFSLNGNFTYIANAELDGDRLGSNGVVATADGNRVPSYTLADLSVTQDFGDGLAFGVAVKNLADKRYVASVRQGIHVGPERSFDVSVRYRF